MAKKLKIKPAKVYTRAQAERAIVSGAVPPEHFLDMSDPLAMPDPKNPGRTSNHQNYHVRRLAWKKLGCPEYAADHAKFLKSLHVKPATTEAA